MNNPSYTVHRRRRQGGVVIILFTIAMVSLFGLAGLALDGGLAYVAKSRVQNAMDAAALAGARVLETNGGNVPAATAEAQRVYGQYLGQLSGYGGVQAPVVEFSTLLAGPYLAGPPSSPNLQFVRVRQNGVQAPTYLLRAVPGANAFFTINGSAVAGIAAGAQPTNQLCNIVPIVVSLGDDCVGESQSCVYGHNVGDIYDIKPAASGGGGGGGGQGNNNGGGGGNVADSIGPGNFNLLALDGNGANVLRDGLAGRGLCADPDAVFDEDQVVTEPGNMVGPTRQGLNQRFPPQGGGGGGGGNNQGPPIHDVVGQENISYAQYQTLLANTPPGTPGIPKRRLLLVVLSDDAAQGRDTIGVDGFACFFLRDRVSGGGNNQAITGEFVATTECNPGRTTIPANPGAGGFTKIILFKDPGSNLT